MLKIKDSVKLEELEKYGFKKNDNNVYEYKRILDGEITAYRVYITPRHKNIQIKVFDTIVIAKSLQELLYKLIKDDLVEVVE